MAGRRLKLSEDCGFTVSFRRVLLFFLAAVVLAVLSPASARAGAQNFEILSFEADYYLSRDAHNIGHLQVTERIVAEFPEAGQYHGIQRSIPQAYENHEVDLRIQRVFDDVGRPLNYTTSVDNDNLVVEIGDADRYVHGRRIYNISYVMTNVTTKSPAGYDGHFWDVNGDQWGQVFGVVTAHVHLSPDLAAVLLPEHVRCFTGTRGSTAGDCTITDHKTANDHVISFTTTRRLQAGETLTYELGFTSGTFAAYAMPRRDVILLVAAIVFLGVLPLLLVLLLILNNWRRYGCNLVGRSHSVSKTTPPGDLSVLASGIILHQSFQPKSVAAQIIDLAIRRYLRIHETSIKNLFREQADYEVELLRSPGDLCPEEKAVVELLFGENPGVGARVSLYALAGRLEKGAAAIGEGLANRLTAAGYFRVPPAKAQKPYNIAGIIVILLGLFAIIVSIYGIGVFLAGILIVVGGRLLPTRTALGVRYHEHLLGLKRYTKMTGVDKSGMPQESPGQVADVGADSRVPLVNTYEKLLPYTMLFGTEKEWAKEFAARCTHYPGWYSGSSGFNAGHLAIAISNFGTASTAPFSSAGGSAGGGGGGGGGGGW